jgi:hypothetical protein
MQEATLSDGLFMLAFYQEAKWKTPNRLIPARA